MDSIHLSVSECEVDAAKLALSLTTPSLPYPDFPDSLDSGFLIRSVQHLAIFSFLCHCCLFMSMILCSAGCWL